MKITIPVTIVTYLRKGSREVETTVVVGEKASKRRLQNNDDSRRIIDCEFVSVKKNIDVDSLNQQVIDEVTKDINSYLANR